MVFGINIEMILAIIIPPMIYAWIIYLSSPYKSLKLKEINCLYIVIFSSLILRIVSPTFNPERSAGIFFSISLMIGLVEVNP